MNIQRAVRYVFAAGLAFFTILIPAALANTTNLSFDASYTTGPFVFYCEPYMATFTAGGLYTPIDGSCAFSLPNTITNSNKVIALYKGTPGVSTAMAGDLYNGSATLVQEDFVPFGGPIQGDDFFAAVFDLNIYTGLNSYFQSGGPLPAGAVENLNYYVMQWKWGVPDTSAPSITIVTPQNGATYLSTDVMLASTTIIDASPIATSTYRFNNVKVDPALPLPLSSAPLGTATLAVSATDIFGNSATATSTFTIASPDIQAPVITITNPVDGGSYFDTATVYLTSTITDVSEIVATSSTFNGATIESSQPLPLLSAPLGLATVSVTAADIYGNVALKTVTFTIKSSDVTPPTVTISNPIAGHTYLNTEIVPLVWSATDPSGVPSKTFLLDDIEINPLLPLPLTAVAAGPASVTVTATDAFGNTASTSVSFIIAAPPPPDGQGPVITIISPVQDKLYLRTEKIYAVVTFADQSAITSVKYYLNGKKIDPDKPLQFQTAPLGTSTFVVKARDKFGNEGIATTTFRVVPGHGQCIDDITEAFDHKWIQDKKTFLNVFNLCRSLEHLLDDRDEARNHHDDSRYNQDDRDINQTCRDIDKNIHQ